MPDKRLAQCQMAFNGRSHARRHCLNTGNMQPTQRYRQTQFTKQNHACHMHKLFHAHVSPSPTPPSLPPLHLHKHTRRYIHRRSRLFITHPLTLLRIITRTITQPAAHPRLKREVRHERQPRHGGHRPVQRARAPQRLPAERDARGLWF